ncbi:MAG TPA: hypothetical protein VJ761_18180 [Ktedonobacteraceae bacterium]|nr:hypothetical protein [Ktedonobacteraceae bacterium]
MKMSSSIKAESIIQVGSQTCLTMGHVWEPTIILGYFLCHRCNKLAACVACVAKVRGKAIHGYCQAHRHLRTCETEQEVLG